MRVNSLQSADKRMCFPAFVKISISAFPSAEWLRRTHRYQHHDAAATPRRGTLNQKRLSGTDWKVFQLTERCHSVG